MGTNNARERIIQTIDLGEVPATKFDEEGRRELVVTLSHDAKRARYYLSATLWTIRPGHKTTELIGGTASIVIETGRFSEKRLRELKPTADQLALVTDRFLKPRVCPVCQDAACETKSAACGGAR